MVTGLNLLFELALEVGDGVATDDTIDLVGRLSSYGAFSELVQFTPTAGTEELGLHFHLG